MVLATAVLAGAGLCAVDGTPAGAAGSTVTLAPGVTLHHSTFRDSAGAQSVWWVSDRFSAHSALVVATPHHVMGAAAMTTLALARQEHAVAGLNGDTFYFDHSAKGAAYNPSLGPRGGIVTAGSTLKAPLQDQNAVFYVTRAGNAHIGPVGFTSRLGLPTGASRAISSVNSVETAWNGNIMLADSRLLSHSMPSCVVATLRPSTTAGRYVVGSVRRHVTRFTRLAAGWHALVTCPAGPSGNAAYLTATLRAGHTVTTSLGYAVPTITTLISGTRQLVRGGRAFHDTAAHRALNVYGNQHVPETFVCVPKDRRGVSIGVFEGQRPGAVGVTYAEETSWLLSQHCWEAMAVDGSTSSTLVAERPHSSLAVQNRPTASQYPVGQRPQVDGIFVVAR